MGMFDYIRCDYPLPGNHPPNVADIDFQTKDTHAQYLEHYQISAQGQLLHEGVAEDFTGEIVFYHSNVVAYGPETYTRDGEDAIWLEYRAIFIRGKVTHIQLVCYESKPAQKARVRC